MNANINLNLIHPTVRTSLLETLIARHTAAGSLTALAEMASGGYVPTVQPQTQRGAIRAELLTLVKGLEERGIRCWTGA